MADLDQRVARLEQILDRVIAAAQQDKVGRMLLRRIGIPAGGAEAGR